MRLHSYELEGRGKVTVALAVMSVCLVWALDAGLDAVDYDPQWWLSVPSFGGFYAALYWIFDNRLWRWRLWRMMGLLNVPDLNGRWAGIVESSYGNGSRHEVAISISQRWSKLLVSFETEYSLSYSISANLKVADVTTPELSYLYINEPKASAPDTMSIHRGTTTLQVKESVLEGDYYTGRGRMTFGSMRLNRTKDVR